MWPCPACAANHLKAASISRPPPISNRPGEVLPGVLAATSPIAKYSYADRFVATFVGGGAAVDAHAHATKHAANQQAIERFRPIADTSPPSTKRSARVRTLNGTKPGSQSPTRRRTRQGAARAGMIG